MGGELGHPDPMDPFDGNSAISLLPRTFKDLKPTQSSMQESLQSLFESLAPRGQDALRDMAETVLKSSSEFQYFKTRQEDVVKDIPTKLKGHVKEPQPAEGRKRARLSIIPNMSQPLLQKSSSSLDQIQDPADFLSAFERLEKPDKELEKQRDHILMDSTQSSSETQQVMQSEDAEKDILANMRDRGRERRPSLGLKPAKFSFKLNTSQPSSVEEMSLDIGKYQDPEEFIAAMDRMERANKEIRRLRGQTDSTEQKSSTTTRERRSGILGKRGTYKHLYPLAEANRDEVLVPSHKASKVDTLNHSSSNTETTNKHTTSQEKEVACDGHLNPLQDLVSEPETTSNGILDELLSDTGKDLDEDEVLERLHIPRLQYEPINLEKFSLPELDILRKTNARALVRSTRPRKALSDIHNVVMGSKRPVETHKISVHPQASHTPSESPLSLVHALRRSIVQKDSCNNLFSFSGIDLSPSQPASSHLGANHDDATDPMLAQATGNGSSFSGKFQSLMTLEDNTAGSSVDVGKLVPDDLAWSPEPRPAEANGNGPGFSDRFQSLMTQEDNTAGNNVNSDKLVTDDLACPPDPTPAQPNGNGSSFSGKFQSLMTKEDNAAGSSMNLDKLVTDDLAYQAEPVDDNLSKLNTQLGPTTNECDDALQDKGEEMQQEVMATPDEQEPAQSGNGQTDYSDPAAGKSHTEDGHPETTIIGPEQNTEGQREPPTMSLNARSELKEPACRRSKRNDLMRRKSLAGAGTVWEAGVRKSTRNKMRPLEYWKGERFLYGRVHESLLTVIGCKYQSPEKDGKSKFKVKYYVSDEHKQLVDQVARH